MNKGIWGLIIAVAFVAGTITTGTVAFAQNPNAGGGFGAIIPALQGIEDAIRDAQIGTKLPCEECVDTDSIADAAVTTNKLSDLSVTRTKLALGSVGSDQIADNAVFTNKLLDNSVTTSKLAAGSITSSKIAIDAVGQGNLMDNSISSTKISNDAVTTQKIADNAVIASKLADNSVSSEKITDGAITAQKLVDDSVTSSKIGPQAVGTTQLADGSITSPKIATNAVNAGNIAPDSVGTTQLTNNAVTGTKVAVGSLGLDRMSSFARITGEVTLTQPEFNVAGFNQVIEEVNLHSESGADADSFRPFVLVSVKPSAPALGVTPYKGDIAHEMVVDYTPPQAGMPQQILYKLQFHLETQPQPPQDDGSPAPGDTAPAGSQVNVAYEAIFLRFTP